MDPNDLYNLATQAGLTGEAANYGTYDDAGPDATAQHFLPQAAQAQGGYTDDDIMAHFVPEAAQDSPAAPPVAPSEPALQSGEKVKAGMSVSNSGYSDKKNQQIAKGPGARLNNEISTIEDEGKAKEAERAGRTEKAAAAEKDAAHGEAVASAQYATALGHQKAILANLEQQHDAKTEAMVQQGALEANETKAKYVAAMNDFRAARVNPAQLWGNMSGGQQFGMLVSAFAHDFLQAKGIKSSSMDTLNKAIDRNIDAQVMAIHQKGEVAQGFKTLWEMQTADSKSMLEARTRMKGFMLDSFKTATEAYMAQFDAQLATAKGRTAIAAIDKELAKTLNEIGQHVDQNTNQRVQQAITRYGDELRASTEAAKIAVDQERNRIEAAKANAANNANQYSGLIFDNTDSGGGKARWEFNDKDNKTANNAFLEKQATTDNILRLHRQYRELQGLYAKNQGLASGTRWGSVEDQQLKNLATEILSARILEKSGKAATDSERKALSVGTPQALFGGTLKIDRVLAQTENIERQGLDSARRAIAHELPESDGRRVLRSGNGSYGEVEKKEAGMTASGEADRTSDTQDAVNIANKKLEKHSRYEPIADTAVSEELQSDHDRFISSHPEDYASHVVTKHRGKDDYQEVERDLNVKNFEKSLSDLAKVAESAKRSGDEETYANAVGRLRVAMDTQQNGDDRLMSDYAAMKLADLDESVGTGPSEPTVPDVQGAPDELDPRAVLPPVPATAKKKKK